jgi:hypothetical protein
MLPFAPGYLYNGVSSLKGLPSDGIPSRREASWNEGWCEPPLEDIVEVHSLEQSLTLYVSEAESIFRIFVQEPMNQTGKVTVFGALRDNNRFSENIVVHSLTVNRVERSTSEKHFVDENAECPPVNFASIALARDDLGSQILGRSTNNQTALSCG